MTCCSLFSGMSTSPEPTARFDVMTGLDVITRLHVIKAQRGHI
jgi:hypothetical protein